MYIINMRCSQSERIKESSFGWAPWRSERGVPLTRVCVCSLVRGLSECMFEQRFLWCFWWRYDGDTVYDMVPADGAFPLARRLQFDNSVSTDTTFRFCSLFFFLCICALHFSSFTRYQPELLQPKNIWSFYIVGKSFSVHIGKNMERNTHRKSINRSHFIVMFKLSVSLFNFFSTFSLVCKFDRNKMTVYRNSYGIQIWCHSGRGLSFSISVLTF